jgi:hypothetical protein
MQWRFITLPLIDMSNCNSTSTYSYFETNITLFPCWKANLRGQLVVATQSIYCQFCGASYKAFLDTKSWCYILIGLLFFSFLHSFNYCLRDNDIAQSHLNFNEWSLLLDLDNCTLGLTYNISPYLILMNLSVDNVGVSFNSHIGWNVHWTSCRLPTSL